MKSEALETVSKKTRIRNHLKGNFKLQVTCFFFLLKNPANPVQVDRVPLVGHPDDKEHLYTTIYRHVPKWKLSSSDVSRFLSVDGCSDVGYQISNIIKHLP